ncbi:MAG: D-isomer specific 2-hydroxyacid dehydrogenase NAD-binding [Frankiales bacterium]|nr:D-isomer specific 2-hydroxyacid dehydrogenase NAD-binding [Frankiales bacterium]
MSIAPETGTARRALLLENIHDDAAFALRDAGYEVERMTVALGEDDLIDKLRGVHLLGLRSNTQLTRRVLEQADALVAVGAFCIGTNQSDLQAATERGVAVFNAPFSNTRSVVELALSEIIALTRRLTDKSSDMHAGVWDKSAVGSHEVRGRRLGIVGYGNIGSQLSVVAEALGMSVLFFDTSDKLALGNARRCGTLEELLAEADVVTLHVDGRAGNSGLFGEEQFARMRPGSIFLNLSRGFVVDHLALRRHIESGHLAGAAVDVFPKEPKRPGEEFVSDLRGLRNVILTPHVGGSTEEAQQDIGNFVAGKLRDYAAGGNTSLSVNLPQVSLPRVPGTTRLLLLHTNTPGVLARVNSILADHGLNIEGQVLGTSGALGYVVTDVAALEGDEVVKVLGDLPETVRLWALA